MSDPHTSPLPEPPHLPPAPPPALPVAPPAAPPAAAVSVATAGVPPSPTVYPQPLPLPAHWTSRLPRGNEMLGIVYGVVVVTVCALAWYLIVSLTNHQFIMLAVAMGFLVGRAVALGSGGSRAVNAVIAVVIASVGMLVSYYFIDRHFLVKELGSSASVPLWDSFQFARELVKAGFKADGSQVVFTLIAAAIAGFFGYKETRAAPSA